MMSAGEAVYKKALAGMAKRLSDGQRLARWEVEALRNGLAEREEAVNAEKLEVSRTVMTKTALAEALGVNRSAVTRWMSESEASGPPPYDVPFWYAWAKKNSKRPSLPPDSVLAALCIAESATHASAPTHIDDSLIALGASLGHHAPSSEHAVDEAERLRMWSIWSKTIRDIIEIKKAQAELMPADEVRELLAQIRTETLAVLAEIPSACASIDGLTAPQMRALQEEVTHACDDARRRLAARGNISVSGE